MRRRLVVLLVVALLLTLVGLGTLERLPMRALAADAPPPNRYCQLESGLRRWESSGRIWRGWPAAQAAALVTSRQLANARSRCCR
jgi:hypothetical protein